MGYTPWNKGKTKESDKRMKKQSETRKRLFKEGELKINFNKFTKGNKINSGKKHSKESKKKMGLSHLGQKSWNKGIEFKQIQKEKHWNWKGGITPMNKLIRSSSKWKIWRELVFLRDNFTCQNKNCNFCNNKIGVMLHPHHIKPLSLYPELVYKIENGITYCKEYHLSSGLHKGINKKQEVN